MIWNALVLSEVIFDNIEVAVSVVDNDPAESPARDHVDLREGVQANHRDSRGEVRKGVELITWEHKAVIDLVTEKGDFEVLSDLDNI